MNTNIGKHVRERRLALKLSQQQLAERAGYSDKSAISLVEAGKVDVPYSKIIQLAAALDTTPSYLMGWDKEDDDATISDRLLTRYRELDDLDQAMVRRLLKCDENFNKI